MESARGRSDSLPLVAVVAGPAALALVTGFVDAVGFLHLFDVFPANQTGNVVFLGLSLAGRSPAPWWAPPLSMVCFTVGVVAGRSLRVAAGRRSVAGERNASVLLGVEVALLGGLAAGLALGWDGEAPIDGPVRVGVLAVAAVAMGVQTEVVRKVAGIGLSTTYQTGSLTTMGEAIADPSRAARRRSQLVAVLGTVLVAYVAGAGLGATRLGEGPTGLLVPAVAVAVLGLLAWWRPVLLGGPQPAARTDS